MFILKAFIGTASKSNYFTFNVIVYLLLLLPYFWGALFFPIQERRDQSKNHFVSLVIGAIVGSTLFLGATNLGLTSYFSRPYLKDFLERIRNRTVVKELYHQNINGRDYQLVQLTRNDLKLSYGGYFVTYRGKHDLEKSVLLSDLLNKGDKVLIVGAGNFLWSSSLNSKYQNKFHVVDNSDLYKNDNRWIRLFEMAAPGINKDQIELIREDAFTYLLNTETHYDVIFWNLTYPVYSGALKLFTYEFSKAIASKLKRKGVFIVESFEHDAIDCTLGSAFGQHIYKKFPTSRGSFEKTWVHKKTTNDHRSGCINDSYGLGSMFKQSLRNMSGIKRNTARAFVNEREIFSD
jgi:hypothetical protein